MIHCSEQKITIMVHKKSIDTEHSLIKLIVNIRISN